MPIERKYARVYYDDLEREYPEVFADSALGWTWLRLLIVAERMWPAVPEVPRWVKPRILARLAEIEIVTLLPPHRFHVRGLDAERSRRQDAARNAAAKRWHSASNAGGIADAMPRRDEPRRDEPNLPPPPAERGRRRDGTSPRQTGAAPRDNDTNPRAQGTSVRQQREDLKRGPTRLGDIMAEAAKRAVDA